MGNAVHFTSWRSDSADRQLFSLPRDVTYLNCASRSPMLRQVEKVGHEAVSLKNEPWRICDDGVAERVRGLFGQLLGVDAGDVALTPSTSYAISQAAHNIWKLGYISEGDSVVVLENQMSSNVYAWQHLCRKVGAKLVAVPQPPRLTATENFEEEGVSWNEAIEACLQNEAAHGRRVAVVAVPHFLWTDGSGPIDLQRLRSVIDHCGRASSRLRAVLVVDATQSLGVVPIDVKACGIDWLACSVHKWLFGPYGLSLVYASERWCQDARSEPIVHDEHNRFGADKDQILPFDPSRPGYSEKLQLGARRFDSGGRANPILLPMVEAALTQVLAWKPERIAETLASLTNRCAAGSKQLGFVTPALHAPHFLGVGPGPAHLENELSLSRRGGEAELTRAEAALRWADAASAHLKKEQGVCVSARAGVLRVAPHVYNSPADVDLFLEGLKSFQEARGVAPP
ncbi:unnamed protein product [Polarella glacialis]|uniref:Aminotransferase class V domain-containing protein n=1 Tax=Polarella glacialis TaxID=89957 RepID=A0A813FFD4_POLGL|nr:unnamed protein product [Polarella glacialis]